MVLSAGMGLYQEVTYKKYGKQWREGLFYTVSELDQKAQIKKENNFFFCVAFFGFTLLFILLQGFNESSDDIQ